MSVDEFLDLMPHTVQIAPRTGQDRYGARTFGVDVSYRCRIYGKLRYVRKTDGSQVVSQQTIALASNANISPEDRLTLSTGYAGSTEPQVLSPIIAGVGRFSDETGQQHHTEIYLLAATGA